MFVSPEVFQLPGVLPWRLPIKFHLDFRSRRRYKRKRSKLKASASRILVHRDRLMNAPKKPVGDSMVRLFKTVESQPRETQLLALAAAFVLMSEAFDFPATDTFQAVTNLMKDPLTSSGKGLQFDAMKFHLQTELDQGGDKFDGAAVPA